MSTESWIKQITCLVHTEYNDSHHIRQYGLDPEFHEMPLQQVLDSSRLRKCLIKVLHEHGIRGADFDGVNPHGLPYQPSLINEKKPTETGQ